MQAYIAARSSKKLGQFFMRAQNESFALPRSASAIHNPFTNFLPPFP
jgi:hypothetical protein